MHKKSFFLLIVLLVQSHVFFGQKSVFGIKPLNDTIDKQEKGFFVLPLLYYTPDTRWAAGAAGVYYFQMKPKGEEQHETRSSYVQYLTDYTQNKQLDIWGIWHIFTRNEDYLTKGEFRYRNFPDKFYGIGNNTQDSQLEKYEFNLLSLKALFLKQVKPSLFAGFDYHFEKEYSFKHSIGKELEKGTITGYNGGITSALGLVSIYDNRDNIINAYEGKYIEFSSYFYSKYFGSTFNFIKLNATYQQYWEVKKKQIIALQSKVKLAYGDVPFLDMAQVGGDDLLRGFPKNRFRDRHFWGTQVEYRRPLFWRLGMVTFAGIGDIFSGEHPSKLRTLKYSLGAGLRFVINPAKRLNLALDYAVGNTGGYYYFVVAEAF